MDESLFKFLNKKKNEPQVTRVIRDKLLSRIENKPNRHKTIFVKQKNKQKILGGLSLLSFFTFLLVIRNIVACMLYLIYECKFMYASPRCINNGRVEQIF